jgi:hypothetical protein
LEWDLLRWLLGNLWKMLRGGIWGWLWGLLLLLGYGKSILEACRDKSILEACRKNTFDRLIPKMRALGTSRERNNLIFKRKFY